MAWINDELILGLETRNPAEFDRIRTAMRQAFAGPEGRVAFRALLTTLRFYREAVTEEERILQNAAKRILYLAGTWVPENEDNLSAAFTAMPIRPSKRKEKRK